MRIKNIVFWMGIWGGGAVLLYALFVWQFQWYIQTFGTIYTQYPPYLIDTTGAYNTSVKKTQVVSKDQVLFYQIRTGQRNIKRVSDFYDANRRILWHALVQGKQPVFLPPRTTHEEHIVDIFHIAYTQDRTHMQNMRTQYQNKIDKVYQQKTITPADKAQVYQWGKEKYNIPHRHVVHLQNNAVNTKNNILRYVREKADYAPIKSPVNGVAIPHNNQIQIYPLDTTMMVKVFVDEDLARRINTQHLARIYYTTNAQPQPHQQSGVIKDILWDEKNIRGQVAVSVYITDMYTYTSTPPHTGYVIPPHSTVQVSLPFDQGSIFAYAKAFLQIK